MSDCPRQQHGGAREEALILLGLCQVCGDWSPLRALTKGVLRAQAQQPAGLTRSRGWEGEESKLNS